MRNEYLLLLVTILLACSEDNSPDPIQPRSWTLLEVENFRGEITPASDFSFNETIVMYVDGTFLKERTEDGEVLFESTGTYAFDYSSSSDFNFLTLIHDQSGPLVLNCYANTEELYIVTEDYIQNTASACDWPIVRFREIK